MSNKQELLELCLVVPILNWAFMIFLYSPGSSWFGLKWSYYYFSSSNTALVKRSSA